MFLRFFRITAVLSALVLLTISTAHQVFAVDLTHDWTYTLIENSAAYDVATDAENNVYIIGYFATTIDFDPTDGVDEHTPVGSAGAFISKYSSDGSYLWTKTFGGDNNISGSGLAVGSNNNIYITGYLSGTADFDPSSGTDEFTSTGSNDVYVTKLTSDGDYLWTNVVGGTGSDVGNSLMVDENDNVYVVGSFQSTVDFDPSGTTDSHASGGDSDGFISKYDANGGYVWTHTIGSTGYDEVLDVALGTGSSLYISGQFSGSVDFDPDGDADVIAAVAYEDGFVSKLTLDGDYVWTKVIGGTLTQQINEVATDTAGNVFLAGISNGTADLDPGAGTASHVSAGGHDSYLVKLSSDGDYDWGNWFGGTGQDQTEGLTVVGNEVVYIAGWFRDTTDFDPGDSVDELTADSADNYSMFVSSYENDGDYLWTKTASGGTETDAWAVDTDATGSLYVGGFMYGTANFNPTGDEYSVAASDNGAMFLTRYEAPAAEEAEKEVVNDNEAVTAKTNNNNTSRSSSSIKTPFCSYFPPVSAPVVYQIDVTSSSATLYFVPSVGPLNKYFIAYGTSTDNYEYGTEFPLGFTTGAVVHQINSLEPNTSYYFRVRAGNHCMPGPWGNTLDAKTQASEDGAKSYFAF